MSIDILPIARAAYEARFADEPPRSVEPFELLPPEAQAKWIAVALAVARLWNKNVLHEVEFARLKFLHSGIGFGVSAAKMIEERIKAMMPKDGESK